MKKTTRFAAFFIAIILTFLCSSCAGGGKEETLTSPEETESSQAETEAATEEESITEDGTEPEETDTQPSPEETTEDAAEIKAPVGGTIAEIVTFYADRANATKAYSGKVTIDKKDGTTSTLDHISIGFLRGTAEDMLPNDYPRTKSKTFTNGKASDGSSIKGFIPVDGDARMSKLSASGVTNAKCEETAKGWKITLILKSETGDDVNYKPPHHAACMDTLALTAEDLKPFTLKNATVKYTGATLTAELNKDGYITYFDVNMPVIVEGNLAYKSVNLIEAVVNGLWRQTLNFTY
jgi:hypothetical protein